MKRITLVLSALALTATTLPAPALDRDANMVDWVTARVGLFDDAETMEMMVWGEKAANVDARNIAWMFGAGYVHSDPNDADSEDGFAIAVGMKYYPVTPLGIAVIGQYEGYGSSQDIDILSARADAKLRLVPASYAVSPYARGIAGIRGVENDYVKTDDDRSTQGYVQFGGGVDVMMTDRMAIVAEGMLSTSEGSSQTYDLDGWLTSLSMKYYFD